MRKAIIVVLTLPFAACSGPDADSDSAEKLIPTEVIATLVQTVPDPAQKDLWQKVDPAGLAAVQETLVAGAGVSSRKPVQTPDRAVKNDEYPPLSPAVVTAVQLLEIPALEAPFDGTVHLVENRGDTLRFDLGDDRSLLLQAKTGGIPFVLDTGTSLRLRLRLGDPFQRDDRLEISADQPLLNWALVGGDRPVTIAFKALSLVVRQLNKTSQGSAAVEISVGDERLELSDFSEPVALPKAGLSVQILGSVAVTGKRAGVVPEKYRLEVVVWPIDQQQTQGPKPIN